MPTTRLPGRASLQCTHCCTNGGARMTKTCIAPIVRARLRWSWRPISRMHTSRAAFRSRCIVATTKRRFTSSLPRGSIRTCSTRITTTDALPSRTARSSIQWSCSARLPKRAKRTSRLRRSRRCRCESWAERIVALNPLDGRALSMGALAQFEDGHVERAFEWSQRAVELYPDDLSALLNNACLKLRSGLHEEALDLLERVFGRGWGKRDW